MVFIKGFRKLRQAFPKCCSKLNTILTTFFALHKTQCNYLSQYAPEPDTRWPSTDARLASKLLHSSCPCLWVCKCLACWTRLLPVTLSGDCEIVALRQRPAKNSSRDPRMLNCKLQTASGEWRTRLKFCGKHQLRLWARLSARALFPGTVHWAPHWWQLETWLERDVLCKQEDANWQQTAQLGKTATVGWLAKSGQKRQELIQFGAELTWLPATLVVVKAAKGNRNPNPNLKLNLGPKPKAKTQNGTRKITLTALQRVLPWLWMRWTFVCINLANRQRRFPFASPAALSALTSYLQYGNHLHCNNLQFRCVGRSAL